MALLPRQRTFGESLATGLGTGLGSGLQMLAQSKLQQMTDAQNAARMTNLISQALGGAPAGEAVQAPVQPAIGSQQVGLEGVQPQVQAGGLLGQLSDEERASIATAAATGSPASLAASVRSIAKERNRAAIKERELAQREMLDRYKETRDYRRETIERERKLREEQIPLKKMVKLSEKGQLQHPLFVNLLKKAEMEWMLNPDSAEYEKASSDLLRRIVQGSKGRVSREVVKQFMKAIPTLATNPEGRKRIEKTLLATNELEMLEPKIMRDIIKESKGKPPFDLAEQVADRFNEVSPSLIDDIVSGMSGTDAEPIVPNDLPDAKGLAVGTKLRNKETGAIEFVNTASGWEPYNAI